MELENNTVRQAYIQLLIDALRRKSEILITLLHLTEQQESLIASEEITDEKFDQIVSQKEEQIMALSKLDDGFEKVYESVQEELTSGKEKYKDEIITLKELIANITDLSVRLQVLEKRNKTNIEAFFVKKRKDIKNSRISNKTAASYYKSMSKQQDAQSYFYDKKK